MDHRLAFHVAAPYFSNTLANYDVDDGYSFLVDSGGHVAFGRLYRGPVPAGHRLVFDDTDSADWLRHPEPADWQGQRLRPRRSGESGRIRAGHVDLLDPWICWAYLRHFAADSRNRPPWPWAGDAYGEGVAQVPVETRLAASPAASEMVQARRGKPRLYGRVAAGRVGRYESDFCVWLARHFGGMDYPASYCFWYSCTLGTVESDSSTSSANLYNEKSLKPHLKH